tara:strand:- start:42 stop:233 length:192 start_codon:yes stop_codon:yes gene_type:complete
MTSEDEALDILDKLYPKLLETLQNFEDAFENDRTEHLGALIETRKQLVLQISQAEGWLSLKWP